MAKKGKIKALALQVKGKAKKAAAEVIGDGALYDEGRHDEAKGKALKKRPVRASIRGH